MRKQKGFSLIELLIVVAIILIIAAIAIPNLLRARIAANESSAVASVRTINTSEVAYQTAYNGVGFSANLKNLGPNGTDCSAPASNNACLIDGVLGAGNKSGYDFVVTPVNNGVINSGYVVGSAANKFNQSGLRDFCSVDDFVIRNQTPTAQSAPTAVYATCQGWTALQ